MNIAIESHVLNHPKRGGLMTYGEGLVYGMEKLDPANQYNLIYYSLTHSAMSMPGPRGQNFRKTVLKVPDRNFRGRQKLIDHLMLPLFFKINRTKIFHRISGYTMPLTKGVFKILTVHDLRTLTIGDQTWKQNIGDYKKALQALDMCVVVSECTKRDILKYFDMPEDKIRVIHLGTDNRFKPASAQDVKAVREKYQINGPFLLSVGSVPRKNIAGIIRAFAASQAKKDHTLVLGTFMEVDKHRQLASELGVADKVMLLSSLTDQEVVALYTDCRAFVFPSLYEGFGLPILEAMQCEAPVITSNVSSCPEIAGDAALLVDPNHTQDIASAMDIIGRDDKLRKELIKKGLERTKLFSWDKFAREMKKVYDLAQ